GYYTTLQSTNLTGPNGPIAASNVAVKVTSTGTVLLTGAANPRVVVADTLVAYQALNSPVTFIKRDTAANSGVIGKYGSYPFLQVSVPAFQAIGNYTATLTYTLIEN
ncbi:MAG TPA: hypothetical protein PKC14_03435, partial [Candidatus Absconditabacterales bacterium]|nr:hypothetical protein [Candidatus Absconditabacterales bacterium]